MAKAGIPGTLVTVEVYLAFGTVFSEESSTPLESVYGKALDAGIPIDLSRIDIDSHAGVKRIEMEAEYVDRFIDIVNGEPLMAAKRALR